MARKPEMSEAWFDDVCSTMVEENLSLRRAAQLHGIVLTEIEANNITRRLAFQATLKRHEYAHFEELGADPRRTKMVLLGRLDKCMGMAMKEGDWKGAADIGLKSAKIEFNIEGEVSGALANLTAQEIEEVKKRIAALSETTTKAAEASRGPIN